MQHANCDRDIAQKNLGLKEDEVEEKNKIIRNQQKHIKDLDTIIAGNASGMTKLEDKKSKFLIDLGKKIEHMLISMKRCKC